MAQEGDAYGNTVTFNKCCLSNGWYQRRSSSGIGNKHTSAFASVKTWHVIHVDIKMNKHHPKMENSPKVVIEENWNYSQ